MAAKPTGESVERVGAPLVKVHKIKYFFFTIKPSQKFKICLIYSFLLTIIILCNYKGELYPFTVEDDDHKFRLKHREVSCVRNNGLILSAKFNNGF